MNSIKNKNFFCSWSGGKDSCLALYRSIQNGGKPQVLLTMMVENGKRSRSHGLPHAVIQSQAEALGIQSIVRSTSWDDYEQAFVSVLHEEGEYHTVVTDGPIFSNTVDIQSRGQTVKLFLREP